jgi:S-formylglutathione hydrolase FrmB
MGTYIMIVMLCYIAPNEKEVCIPMTPSPQIYYKSKQSCNDASIIKKEEMKKIAEQNNLLVTGVFSDCIKSNNNQV